MKILFLNHKIPFPPDKGDRIPGYYRMLYLSKSHEVSMVFPCYKKEELGLINVVKTYCASVDTVYIPFFWAKIKCGVAALFGRSITKAFSGSFRLRRKVKRLLAQNKFDVVYVYSSGMAQYVERVTDTPKVIDLADADSHKWIGYAKRKKFPMSVVYKREGAWLKNYEKLLCQKFDKAIAISEDEKNLFAGYIPNLNMEVVSNGVDLEYFSTKLIAPSSEGRHSSELIANSNPISGLTSLRAQEHMSFSNSTPYSNLVFVGVMDYYANVDAAVYFAKEVLPIIKLLVPEVMFYIVGVNPAKDVLRLTKDKSVVVTGKVDDVRDYLRSAAVCVAPMRIAQGVQNKILQALACGVPVVTTSKGNEGIRAEVGREIFVEDDTRKFAERVVALLNSKELRDQVSSAARAFVESKFDWDESMRKFEGILREEAHS